MHCMEFKVPQNLEVEDKLFGPFTITQFIYLVGGAGVVFLLWQYLPTFVALLLIVPVAVLTWALIFFPESKYGKPFPDLLEDAFSYFASAKLYTWQKREEKKDTDVQMKKMSDKNPDVSVPRVSQSKLKNLSWNLDVSKGTSQVDEEEERAPRDT